MKRINNLEAYNEWFNRLSYQVATEVCIQDKKIKNRYVYSISLLIQPVVLCYEQLQLAKIVAGLHVNPVQRLKKTWAKANSGNSTD